MRIRYKLVSTAIAAMIGSAFFFTSCEDECVDCKCNMVVNDVISTTDATETPLKAVKFDDYVILRGSGLSNVNKVEVFGSAVVNGNDTVINKTLYLNPTQVTESAIIVELADIETENIDGFNIYSKTCAEPLTFNIKGYPDPVVNGFYCEFVPNGGSLRIGGNYFYGTANSDLTAQTYDAEGNAIPATITSNTSKEIIITVPDGTADGSAVTITSASGSSVTSKCKLRDNSGVFLNFDDLIASDYCGATTTEGVWKDKKSEALFADKLPEELDDNYALLTYAGWWDDNNMIVYHAATSGRENPKTNLLGDGADSYDPSNNDYVLKFEVNVPVKLAAWFQIIFYAYESESSEDVADQRYDAGAASYIGNEYCTEKLGSKALANANWVAGDYIVTEDAEKGEYTKTIGNGFTSDGWMTVAIPLTKEFFKYACSDYGHFSYGKFSPGSLTAEDFYNFTIRASGDNDLGLQTQLNGYDRFLVAFDNFRIVKDDGSGTIFGNLGSGTVNNVSSMVRDYFK